jgi:glycosyltransferase involved in cell wall biosynthesis
MGGAGVYVAQVAPELSRLGHEMHVIAPGQPDRFQQSYENGVYVHRLRLGSPRSQPTLAFWSELPRAFSRIAGQTGGFDLVHSNGIADLTLTRRAAPQPRAVTVHHLSLSCLRALRPSLSERLRQPGGELGLVPYLEPIVIQRARRIIAVSGYTRDDLVATLGVHPGKIDVIRHGASPEEYRFAPGTLAALRERLGLGEQPLILCVGRLEPRKGTGVLLRALVEMRRPDVKLVLAGSGNQEPYRALAQQLGIADRVIIAGRVDDLTLRQLYAACDVVAFPSLLEGLGIVALEGRAAGKPVVASAIGGIPEVVPAGAGYLVPPGEPAPLACALLQALHTPHGVPPPAPSWTEAGRQLSLCYQAIVA